MPGLHIIVLSDDAERLRGALVLALAHAARGGAARLFLQLEAARLLYAGWSAPNDDQHRTAGLPTLAELLDEALGMDVILVVCQSGLSLTGLSMDDLDSRIVAGGPVSFLAAVGESDRLLTV